MTSHCYTKDVYAAEENVLGSYTVNTTRVSIRVSTDDNDTPLSVESLRRDDASIPSLRNEYQDDSAKDDSHTKDDYYGNYNYYGGNDYYHGINDDYGKDNQYGYDDGYGRDNYYGNNNGYVKYDNYEDDHGMDTEHKSGIEYDKD